MESYDGFHPAGSPLYMVMHDPVLHQFISYLAGKKAEQERNPGLHVRFELSRSFMNRVRDSFRHHILEGERHLHVLCHVLAAKLLDGDFELHSNAIGVLPGGENRPFLIRERITREILRSHTDIDLGNQMLSNFRYMSGGAWTPLELSANFVEYLPAGRPSSGVNRITSRVKAEEELWNKVADEIFDLDNLLERDKHLRQYSKYIKDIFGLKIVCEDEATCLLVHAMLERLRIEDCDLSAAEGLAGEAADPAPQEPGARLLAFVETKDYLTCDPSAMKKTGWKALKSVVRWHGQLLEIQVQPLANYYLELDHMSGPSHRSFKLLRDSFRAEVAGVVPLYEFYRTLLRMLFQHGNGSIDSERASVIITE